MPWSPRLTCPRASSLTATPVRWSRARSLRRRWVIPRGTAARGWLWNYSLSSFPADRKALPAAVRWRQRGDHGQEAHEARRDQRTLGRQRGDHQEAPGFVLQSDRARHCLLREPRHCQKGAYDCRKKKKTLINGTEMSHFHSFRVLASLRSTPSCPWTRFSVKSAKSLMRCSKT